jgi:aconitate hydratase
VLPFRSDIPRLAGFTFSQVDDGYVQRAREAGTHAVVAGENYGQGSSREHAVIAPRYLGLRLVIAKSYARIHWQNLANFGVLAAEFADPADYDRIEADDELSVDGLTDALGSGSELTVRVGDQEVTIRHRLSPRQVAMVLAGGQIPLVRCGERRLEDQLGGLWLWKILVPSGLRAVVVPSGCRATVQPHW